MSEKPRTAQHEKLDYVEFASRNLSASKAFFEKVFSWVFTDYGPDYSAFSQAGLEGGFYRCEDQGGIPDASHGSALLVFYSENLESTQGKVERFGGVIVKPIFSFPGGRRFQFKEPGGNELAVWSNFE